MPSRVRRTIGPKDHPFQISELGQKIVAPVALAVRRLANTLAEEASEQLQQREVATRALERAGLPVPKVDVVPQSAVTAAAIEVLARLQEFVTLLQRSEEGPDGGWAGAVVARRIRAKPGRIGEKLKFETTIAAHAAWAVWSSEAEPPGCRLANGMAIDLIAASHLHFPGGSNAICTEDPCKRLAVCRNLVDLLDARPTPVKLAFRYVAQAAFDAAGAVASVCRHLGEAHAPNHLIQHGKELAARMLYIDERLRAVSGDVPLPRGKHAPEVTRRAVTLELVLAGFDDDEVCALVDDGSPSGAQRLRNHRRLVDRCIEERKRAENPSEPPFVDWRTSWVAERKT